MSFFIYGQLLKRFNIKKDKVYVTNFKVISSLVLIDLLA